MHYNRNQSRKPLPIYEIHPTSLKLVSKGHPWITLDAYSEKFHPNDKFIIAKNRGKPFALFIHDPTHKKVRARLWSKQGNFDKQIRNFKQDLTNRLRAAIQKRADKKILEDRNHFYLVFGEGDQVPGLFVSYLNGEILIQTYTDYWNKHQDYIIQQLTNHINNVFKLDIDFTNFWLQLRSDAKLPAKCLDPNITFKHIELVEKGIKFKATLGKYYDHGIYTDMAALRKKMGPLFKDGSKVLNLYSYTGAFSLFALEAGAEQVTSVDLSEQYMKWLEENIDLNEDFNNDLHESLTMSVNEAIAELQADGRKFDLIISDPPSSSSDGNSVSNSFQNYSYILKDLNDLLTEEGQILALLNTHKTTFRRFEEKVKKTLYSKKLPLFVSKKYFLHEDCPTSKNFPEGSYLKGLLLKRKNKKEEVVDKEIKEQVETTETS